MPLAGAVAGASMKRFAAARGGAEHMGSEENPGDEQAITQAPEVSRRRASRVA